MRRLQKNGKMGREGPRWNTTACLQVGLLRYVYFQVERDANLWVPFLSI